MPDKDADTTRTAAQLMRCTNAKCDFATTIVYDAAAHSYAFGIEDHIVVSSGRDSDSAQVTEHA